MLGLIEDKVPPYMSIYGGLRHIFMKDVNPGSSSHQSF